nr:hypothetical protein [Desulfobacteraceae bacterium]
MINDGISVVKIQSKSLLCKLLALKANDKGVDPKLLVKDIYQTVSQMKDHLTNDQLLLVEQFVSFYKKISDETFEAIKKEVDMTNYASTISEYFKNEGKNEGRIEGTLSVIDNLVKSGINWAVIAEATGINQQKFQEMQHEYQMISSR